MLRVLPLGFDDCRIWPPGMRSVFRPAPGVMPGVTGEARFQVNSLGLRGDEPSATAALHVLALGGSTTECLYLDQAEAWPQRLEAELCGQGLSVWIGNGGKSGRTTRDHVVQLERLLAQEPRFDVVLLLAGVNDLTLFLALGDDSYPRFLERPGARARLLTRAFDVLPNDESSDAPFWRRSATWRGLARMRDRFASQRVQDEAGSVYERWRAQRAAAAPHLAELPDLTPALEEFERNLRALAAGARAHGCKLVLLTQPALWGDDLPAEVERLLWLGGQGDFQSVPGARYYAAGALQRGLERFNEIVRGTAQSAGLVAVDLAHEVGRDPAYFYDDVHLNEAGSARVAEVLARALAPRFSR
jgi:lysophospholipase L1-like esterase